MPKEMLIWHKQTWKRQDWLKSLSNDRFGLNQTVKRNIERYPEDVMFQLDRKDVFLLKSQQESANEYNADLRSQFVTLKGSTTGSDTEEINIIETSLRSQIVTY